MLEDLQYANSLLQENRVDEALKLIESKAEIADLDEQFTIGELYFDWGFLDEALETLQKIEAVLPTEEQVKLFIASIYTELENDSDAIETLTRIDSSDEFYLPSLMQLADLYESQGLFEVAELKLREAKSLNSDDIFNVLSIGHLFFILGDYIYTVYH